MSDSTATTNETVDAEMLAHIEAEAAAQGLSVDDYLNNALLARLMTEPQAPAQPVKRDDAAEFRMRLTALERRLSLSFSSLEGAIAAIDGVIAETANDLAHRVDVTQAEMEEGAEAIEAALVVVRTAIDGLAEHMAEEEAKNDARALAIAAAAADMNQSVGALELRLEATEAVVERDGAAAEEAVERLDVGIAECAARLESLQALGERRAQAVDTAIGVLRAASDELDQRIEGQNKTAAVALHQVRAAIGGLEQRLDDVAESTAAALRENAMLAEAGHQSETRMARRLEALLHHVDTENSALKGAVDDALADAVAIAQTVAAEAADAAAEASGRMALDLLTTRDQLSTALSEQVKTLHDALATARREQNVQTTALEAEVKVCVQAGDRAIESMERRLVERDETMRALMDAQSDALEQRAAVLQSEVNSYEVRSLASLHDLASRFGVELTEVRERQAGGMARLHVLETDLARANETITQAEENANGRLENAVAAFDTRFAALESAQSDHFVAHRARLDSLTQQQIVATANIARFDAKFSEVRAADAQARDEAAAAFDQALQDLRAPMVETQARLFALSERASQQDSTLREACGALEEMAQRLAAIQGEAHGRGDAMGAHDGRLGAIEAALASISERVAALHGDAESHIGAQAQRIAALEASAADRRLNGRIDDLKARVMMQEQENVETADRLAELAQTMGAFVSQQSGGGDRFESRMHALELALADLRLAHFEKDDQSALEHRVGELEHLVSNASLEDLRRGVEERMLAMETKNVRMLQQLNETIAHLAKKWDGAPVAADMVAKSA
ncbi:MAG: hypothetical protein ABUS48_04525 [Pseudomonadota bacterium]